MPVFDNSNYWAVILGGSSGIGLACARKLAAEGMHLLLVHRDRRSRQAELEKEWESLRKHGIQLHTFNTDAVKKEKREEVIQQISQLLPPSGNIRCLLHAIAKGNLKPMASLEGPVLGPDDFALTIQAMATSLYEWVRSLFEAGLFAPDARVLGLTSEGNRRAWRHYGAVSAAKAALEAISRQIALELAPHGIRCNVVQAGVTDTPSLRLIPGSDLLKQHALGRNPFRRLTKPEDVADAVFLLCTDEAAWINGAVIPVDGGERIG